jgi:hypothetical protein
MLVSTVTGSVLESDVLVKFVVFASKSSSFTRAQSLTRVSFVYACNREVFMCVYRREMKSRKDSHAISSVGKHGTSNSKNNTFLNIQPLLRLNSDMTWI